MSDDPTTNEVLIDADLVVPAGPAVPGITEQRLAEIEQVAYELRGSFLSVAAMELLAEIRRLNGQVERVEAVAVEHDNALVELADYHGEAYSAARVEHIAAARLIRRALELS